jgi:hypothetical protein
MSFLPKTYFLILLTLFSSALFSQEHKLLSQYNDSLSSLQHKIGKAPDDSTRQALNHQFRSMLKRAIDLPGSFSYPFDSLKKLARLTSPDGAFRIYNWNLPVTDGSNQYFCYLQIRSKENKHSYNLLELNDSSDSIIDPEHTTLNARNWYGALYYKIIAEKAGNTIIYTLLGWEGKNGAEMQKIIEILTFDTKGIPHFGKKIFNKYLDGKNIRIIFRYSPTATMALRFEDQAISKGKKYNARTRTFGESHTKAHMIVCDRLVTVDAVEGKGMVIAPAGDVYDGFLFENGHWNFILGVDARNH